MEFCDEQRIVDGLRNGDVASWREFYVAFAEPVWRTVAVRLSPRKADIVDVVQNTFLRAVANIHGFDATRGRLEPWLLGVACYQVREWLRREARHNRLANEDSDDAVAETLRRITENQQGRIPDPSELLQKAETVTLVREVLEELTPDHAYVLMAKYMDDLPIKEMAAEMDLSSEAVRAKLTRARRAFRRLFERHPEEIGQPPAHDNR